jgi:hypothetical protein
MDCDEEQCGARVLQIYPMRASDSFGGGGL